MDDVEPTAEPLRSYGSPEDPGHRQELAERYPCCTHIEAADERAMTYRQLSDTVSYALERCSSWQLLPGCLNHYDLVNWLVNPSTEATRCAFVELVARAPQPVELFVTHFFGQSAKELLQCLQQELCTRQLPEDTTFWLWAFARRFGASYIPETLHGSDSFQAMRSSRGLVLPLGTSSLPFSRTWCLIETRFSLELQKSLDIVAMSHSLMVLTQHCTEAEASMENKTPGAGFREKSQREQLFPAEAMVAALDLSLERSDCKSKIDRNLLLHKLLEEDGLEVATMPLHRQFEKANVRLRGLFASMMWPLVVESERLPQKEFVNCIKADVSREDWFVNFSASKAEDSHLSLLAQAIHAHLTSLDLNCFMCQRLTGRGVEELARSMPLKLKTLKLNFKLCAGVGQGGVDALASLPEGLTELHLNFSYSEVRSVAVLCQSIKRAQSLKLLDLDLSGVPTLNDKSLQLLAETVAPSRIKNLFMAFRSCRSVGDPGFEALGTALPPCVTLIKLDYADCNISDSSLDACGNRLCQLQHLGVVQLNLQGCDVSESAVARLVARLPKTLRGAKVNLSNTTLPWELQKLCRRLGTMRSWQAPRRPPSKTSKEESVVQSKALNGLKLHSVDLFLHRGQIQSVSPPKAKPVMKELTWLDYPDAKRLRRAFSEPHVRQHKPLLPKVAQAPKDTGWSMTRPECMFSKPRTTYQGFTEPIWYP